MFNNEKYCATIDLNEKVLLLEDTGKAKVLRIKFNQSAIIEKTEDKAGLKCIDGLTNLVFSFKKNYIEMNLNTIGSKLVFPGEITGNFDEFYNWTPVVYRCVIPKYIPMEFAMGSRMPIKEGPVYLPATYAGKFVIPAYLFSLSINQNSKIGFGYLDVPESEYTFAGEIYKQKLNLTYSFNANSKKSVKMGIFFSEKFEGIAQTYSDVVAARKKYPLVSWWNEPWYDSYFEQLYEMMESDGESQYEYGALKHCTGRLLKRAIGAIEKNKLGIKTIVIGPGWSAEIGDFNIKSDVAQEIKALKKKGYKIILTLQPYIADESSDVYKNNPNFFVYPEAPRGKIRYKYVEFNKEFAQFDYTNPETRAYMKERITSLFENFNIDGFKIDRTSALPTVNAFYNDAAWGVGELLQKKTLGLIYDTVKQLKKESLVILPALNPLYNDVCDVNSLGYRHFFDESVDDYGRRVMAALDLSIKPLYIDEASGFSAHTPRHLAEKCAYGVPSIFAVLRRAVTRMKSAVFTGGYPVDAMQQELNLMNSILSIYNFSKLNSDDSIYCENDDKVFYRKYSTGPLKGFYSIALFSGSEVLAGYKANSALLCSSVDVKAVVAVPPNKKVTSIVKVKRNGKEEKMSFDVVSKNKILIEFECSEGGTKYYRMNYK